MQEIKLPYGDTYMNVIRFGHGKKPLAILAGVNLLGLEGIGAAVEAQYRDFDRDYDIFLFDRKKVLPRGYATEDMAEDVYTALRLFGAEKVSVVGVSHGGMMALSLTLAHPELVDRLLLVSTTGRTTESLPDVTLGWIRLAASHDAGAINDDFKLRVYSDAYAKKYADAFAAQRNIGTAADCERFRVLAEAMYSFDRLADVKAIRCPTLVIGAEKDGVFGVGASVTLAKEMGAELYIYEDAPHAVYDENPDFLRRAKEFFER